MADLTANATRDLQSRDSKAGSKAAPDSDALLNELDSLAWLLDSRWRVPGTGFRFGVDAVAGLIPGLGDAATALPSAYMVWRARQFGLPAHVMARMVGNVGLDFAIGAIPIVGSLFDFAFKANRRNVKLLRRHLERRDKHGQGDAVE